MDSALTLVQHHDGQRPVQVHEGGHLQRVAAGAADGAPGAGPDVAREVAEVPVAGLQQDLVPPEFTDDGRHAVVACVVWPPDLVQHQVPVDPALATGVHVSDYIHGISLRQLEVPERVLQRPAGELLAALRLDDVLVGPQLGHAPHVLEAQLRPHVHQHAPLALPVREGDLRALRPGLEAGVAVPVVSHTPNVLCRLRITVRDCRSFQHTGAVVVPDQHLHAPLARGLQRRAQIATHEVALLRGREEAGLPGLGRLRLVLHAHAPDCKALVGHGLHEAHVVQRPGLTAVATQLTAAREGPIGLHPGRRRPRACEQRQRDAGLLRRPAHEGQDGLAVPGEAEAAELVVAVREPAAEPVARAEVAGAYVHAAEAVAHVPVGAEVRAHHLLLLPRRHLAERRRRRLGKTASEPYPRLRDLTGRVHED
mmetsp:Transcript_144288/g.350303  ORF Transcript_144288/g.350303 Transcript_144288/m.350303 type:complete len:424 (+) Transcript_144288:91-1362(+)